MSYFKTEIPKQFALPRRINRLDQLAYNLWWTWNPEAERLFQRVDRVLWEHVYHNPVRFLQQVNRNRLKSMTQDRYYLDFYDRILRQFDDYLRLNNTWFSREHPDLEQETVAYFSTEFGLHGP